MDFNDLVERSKRRLNAGQPEPHVWVSSEIDLAACVQQAIAELSQRVMMDSSLRTLLQQDYSVTLDANGIGDPLAAVGSITGVAGEVLQEGIKFGVVIDADGNVLVPITHYSDFLRPQAVQLAYYCLKDRKILTRALGQAVNGPSDIFGVSSPLTITASFEPQVVDSFPDELADDLVNTLCKIVTTKITPA